MANNIHVKAQEAYNAISDMLQIHQSSAQVIQRKNAIINRIQMSHREQADKLRQMAMKNEITTESGIFNRLKSENEELKLMLSLLETEKNMKGKENINNLAADKEIEKLKKECDDLKTQLAANNSEEIDNLRNQIIVLKSELASDNKSDGKELKNETEKLKADLAIKAKQYDIKAKEYDELKMQWDEVDSMIDEGSSELIRLKQENRKLKAKVKARNIRIRQMRLKLDDLNDGQYADDMDESDGTPSEDSDGAEDVNESQDQDVPMPATQELLNPLSDDDEDDDYDPEEEEEQQDEDMDQSDPDYDQQIN